MAGYTDRTGTSSPDRSVREGGAGLDAGPLGRALPGHPARTHLQRMRELTELKRSGTTIDALLADHGLFHLEADLRWIDLTSARLDSLTALVRS
jgi:hypothetical protein